MDPQHRLLLEAAAHLLPAAGSKSHLDVQGAGVFVGISWSEYSALCKAHGAEGGPYAAQGAVLRWVGRGERGLIMDPCLHVLHDVSMLLRFDRARISRGCSCKPAPPEQLATAHAYFFLPVTLTVVVLQCRLWPHLLHLWPTRPCSISGHSLFCLPGGNCPGTFTPHSVRAGTQQ